MMKKIYLALLLLIAIDAFSGNPVMFVRCAPRVAAGFTADLNPCEGCPSGYVFYDPNGECSSPSSKGTTSNSAGVIPAQCILTAEVDISAPSGYSCGPGLVLDSIMIGFSGGSDAVASYTYICVPDCKDVECIGVVLTFSESASESTCPEIGWSLQHQKCGCEDPNPAASLEENENIENTTGIFDPCGCPPGYGQETSPRGLGESATFDPYSPCVILESDDCYSGDVDFYIEPFTCESTNPEAVITIVITGPSGGPDFVEGDVVSIEDLENCVLTTDDLFLLALSEEYGVDASFVADENGEVIIEFTRDPTQESVLDFGGSEVVIPACTAANASLGSFDPCSCDNPENVLNAAQDAILYWKDILTIVGTSGNDVLLTTNGNPTVFLKSANSGDSYLANDNLGTIGSNGILEVPFFRDASTTNQALNITFRDATNPLVVGSDMSVCSEAPVPCLANPIPTLGEWSIFILSLLVLIFGVIGFQFKQDLSLVKIR